MAESKIFKLRRGTTAQNEGYVGGEGEQTYDTETKETRIHDGVTAGGRRQAMEGHPPNIFLPDPLRASVESATGGRCTVIYTDKNQPSYMHVLPIFNIEDIPGLPGTGPHPAFLRGGVRKPEILVGMYQASEHDGEALSLPGQDPHNNIDYDASRALCQANGANHDMMSNWDWAAIALWCMANGYQPRGNTDYGRHHNERHETGVRQDGTSYDPGQTSGSGRILTGSGPNAWRHESSPAGIADLVGNIWEWVTGFKIVDRRVFISPDNDIVAESSYTDSGFDLPSGGSNPWSSMDPTGASDLLKQALIVPNGTSDPIGRQYQNDTGERLPGRGGSWAYTSNAGLGALYLSIERTSTNTRIGFRPAFIP